MKNLSIKHKSIKYKTFIMFISLTCIILATLWLTSLSIARPINKNIKKRLMQDSIEKIVSDYTNGNNYEVELQNISFEKDLNILIFTIDKGVGKIYFQSAKFSNQDSTNAALNLMLNKLGVENEVSYIENTSPQLDSWAVGKKILQNEEWVYFYISTPLEISQSTQSFIYTLLLIITIITLAISISISLLFTNKISKPIIQFVEEAKAGTRDFKQCIDTAQYTELKDLSIILSNNNAELEKVDIYKQTFLNSVSNNIYLPISSIRTSVESIMNKNIKNKKDLKLLETIILATDKLETFNDDIVKLSLIQSNNYQYNNDQFNLSEALLKTILDLEEKYAKDGFVFEKQIPRKIMIKADKLCIMSVIKNYIYDIMNLSQDNKEISIKLIKQINTNIYKLEIKNKDVIIAKDSIDLYLDDTNTNEQANIIYGSILSKKISKLILDNYNLNYGIKSKRNIGSVLFIDFTTI